jgi:hypothetical protein
MFKRLLMPTWVAFSFGAMATVANYAKPSNNIQNIQKENKKENKNKRFMFR